MMDHLSFRKNLKNRYGRRKDVDELTPSYQIFRYAFPKEEVAFRSKYSLDYIVELFDQENKIHEKQLFYYKKNKGFLEILYGKKLYQFDIVPVSKITQEYLDNVESEDRILLYGYLLQEEVNDIIQLFYALKNFTGSDDE